MNEGIKIVGAGLVGSLLATMLAKKGFKVSVFEKRSDPRETSHLEGRSINLALSHRGIKALEHADVFKRIEKELIPMHGRKMHDKEGALTEQAYGKEGQFINSVSRSKLNLTLIEEAEKSGVSFHFEHECKAIDFEKSAITFTQGNGQMTVSGSPIFATDGAFSAVRTQFTELSEFKEEQVFIDHGYKELKMPPRDGDFAMPPNFLHIWPRGNFMLIALPNQDKTFTCTLFLPFKGSTSFEQLNKESAVRDFFGEHFSDILPLIPDLEQQFLSNPTSSLVTLKCYPWLNNNTLLLGDASHAIVPFYGQGMNAGFEDCRLLMEMAERRNYDWGVILTEFQEVRKKDADAIADLALKNFVEMRDWVGDDKFLFRKKIESQLSAKYPDQWMPQYSMVTFSDTPYSEAKRIADVQDKVLVEFLHHRKIEEICDKDLGELIGKFNQYLLV
ncbi:MAG: NAD(P)/FAD-dependent oxidoreductase [Cyclobacteriaceae bacterium]